MFGLLENLLELIFIYKVGKQQTRSVNTHFDFFNLCIFFIVFEKDLLRGAGRNMKYTEKLW